VACKKGVTFLYYIISYRIISHHISYIVSYHISMFCKVKVRYRTQCEHHVGF
jgi:hypothetical protein